MDLWIGLHLELENQSWRPKILIIYAFQLKKIYIFWTSTLDTDSPNFMHPFLDSMGEDLNHWWVDNFLFNFNKISHKKQQSELHVVKRICFYWYPRCPTNIFVENFIHFISSFWYKLISRTKKSLQNGFLSFFVSIFRKIKNIFIVNPYVDIFPSFPCDRFYFCLTCRDDLRDSAGYHEQVQYLPT